MTPGRRIHPLSPQELPSVIEKRMEPGDYCHLQEYGKWLLKSPDGDMGCLSDGHKVTEHEDGTITVSPSVHFQGAWHGWLEKGNWRSV